MKSFTSILLLVALSNVVMSSAIPRDVAPASTSTIESSLANASPPPASLAHPLSLLYPRANENQDVHTQVVSSSCQKCTKSFIDCTKIRSVKEDRGSSQSPRHLPIYVAARADFDAAFPPALNVGGQSLSFAPPVHCFPTQPHRIELIN
ncbi:hypothetical protein IG631_21980 [Alternaria alternata]|nr:hypothetical protein IG631_21980 [Alternaria alternata]